MEHDIPFGNSNRENGTTFLDFPLFLGIFQWDEPTKRVPFTAEPEIPEILTNWKAPTEYWLSQAYITCTPYKVYSIIFGSGELGRNVFCKYTVHVAVHVCAINILCDQGTEIVCGLCVFNFKCCSFVFVGFHHNSFPSLTMA